MSSEFPWDTLKAETLRTLCKDLELPASLGRKREDMVNAMKSVEKIGLDEFLKQHEVEHERMGTEREKTQGRRAVAAATTIEGRPASGRVRRKSERAIGAESGVIRSSRKGGRSTFDGVELRSSRSARRRSTKSAAS